MIIKALDNGKFCVWNGLAHEPVDDKEFDTMEQAEKYMQGIENALKNLYIQTGTK